ncbi:MAG: phospholipid carrier-dependent glycosyltransferase [Planctomycetes bacterium]|nr:phospholipid carrier-dependent glycosyltransferase [Planctomycetota bacterium]
MALFLGALLLRVVALPQGGPPHDYVPDEHAVRAALAMLEARDPLLRDGSPSSYPHLLPWLIAPLEALLYLGARARGAVASPEEFGAQLAVEPWPAFLVARALCALLGALTALVAVRLARRLGASSRTAWIAGALIAVSPLHVLLSAQARPWAPLGFFFLLAVERSAFSLRARGRGTVGAALAAGAAAALHPLGFAAFLPWLGSAAIAARHRVRSLWLGAALATALVMLAYPSQWGVSAQRTPQEFAEAPLVLGGQGLYARFDGARAGELALELALMEPALLLALALALIDAVRGGAIALPRRARGPRCLAQLLALFLGAFFLLYFGTLLRYFLPALLLVATVSAARLERARGLVLVALLASAATSARLSILLAREDTRTLAARELERSFLEGRVALEAGGPRLVLDRFSLERLRAIDATSLTRRERAALESERDAGQGALPLERVYRTRELRDFARGYARLWSREGRPDPADPAERLRLVLWAEAIGAVMTARRDADDGSRLLDAELARRGELRFAIDPATVDARLPGEPQRGWLTLWSAAQPGPRIACHALRDPAPIR